MVFQKRLIVALVVIFMFFIANPAFAEIKIKELDTLPKGAMPEAAKISTQPIEVDDKLVPLDTVVKEVYWLQKTVPGLHGVDWNIYLIKKQASRPAVGLTELWGHAYKDSICLFTYHDITDDKTSHVSSHEIGHLVRYRFVASESLKKYHKDRMKGKEVQGYYEDPEELFAEDFSWLFGSDGARKKYYEPSCKKPGIIEKVWILANIMGTSNIYEVSKKYLSWQENLELYSAYPPAGHKEIERAGQAYNENMRMGDMARAKAAHRWANMIRKELGIPIQ